MLFHTLVIPVIQMLYLLQVKILPPKGLYHPVLPVKMNGKLLFPLCWTCAIKETNEPCNCTLERRSIVGTWCTPEIIEAVKKGYTIIKIYEVSRNYKDIDKTCYNVYYQVLRN